MSNNKSNFEGKSLLFIALKILCWWPSFISALIATQVTYYFSHSWKDTLLVFMSVFSVTAYGFTINNIIDAEKDKFAPRKTYKLIFSKRAMQVAKIQAILFVCLAIGLGLFLPTQSLIILCATLVLLSVYSFINNKYGLIANVLTSLCVSALVWVYPISGDFSVFEMVILSLFMFLFILSREIYMDDYDFHSDKKYGKRSLPISIGRQQAKLLSLTIVTTTVIVLSFIVFNYSLNIKLLVPIIGAPLISYLGYIKYYVDNSDKNFKLFFNTTSFAYITFFGVFI